jgi:hypothetical protein
MPGRSFVQGNKRAARLRGEQVIEIRERYATERGCTQARLSRDYGVTVGTIANIVNGLTWQNITGGDEVDRPPPHAIPPPMPSEAELHKQIDQAMARAKALAPSLYSDPPPDDPGAIEAARRAQAKVQTELDRLQPGAEGVNESLDKLTKGD